jgi:hypothetical protein
MREAFFKFCEEQKNSSSLLFLNEVEKLLKRFYHEGKIVDETKKMLKVLPEKLKDTQQLEEKLDFIYTEFIASNASKALNISSESKTKIEEKLELLRNYSSQKHLIHAIQILGYKYYELFRTIKYELYLDTFASFVRSEICLQTILKNQLEKNPLVLVSGAAKKFPYVDQDFQSPNIQKKDFDFFLQLFDDSFEWELIKEKQKDGFSLYVCKGEDFFPNAKIFHGSVGCKIAFNVDVPLPDVVEASFKENYNKDFFISNEIKFHSESGNFFRSSESVIYTQNLPFPLDSRKYMVTASYYYDPTTKTFISIAKPFLSCEEIPDFKIGKKQKIKGKFDDGKEAYVALGYFSRINRKLGPNKTLAGEVTFINYGGWYSSFKDTKNSFVSMRDKGVVAAIGDVDEILKRGSIYRKPNIEELFFKTQKLIAEDFKNSI